MTTIDINVDEETAAAFEAAPPQKREQLLLMAAAIIRASLAEREDKAEGVRRAAEALSREAQANGWTEEMNEALLRGDFDDGE